MLSSDIPDAYLTIALGIFPSSWNITEEWEEGNKNKNDKWEERNEK